MPRDQDDWIAAPCCQRLRVETGHAGGMEPNLFQRDHQGVNDGVACDEDRVVAHAFADQVLPAQFRRREVQRGETRGQDAIGLLGPRRLEIPGAQSGLDMPQRNAPVESRQRRREGCRRVTLRQDDGGLLCFQVAINPLDCARRQPGQRLTRLHQI